MGAARRHPVRRDFHALELHVGGGDVGQCFADRDARCSRGVDHRERRAFADRHRFTRVAVEADQGHRTVGNRHLPRPDHRISGTHSPHRAVADRDQECLAGDRGMPQYVERALLDVQARAIERRQRLLDMANVAMHARGFAEQHAHRHVDRERAAGAVDHQLTVVSDAADHRVRTALAPRDPIERRELVGRDRQRIALLRLVAPDLERTHSAFLDGNVGEHDASAALGLIREFRHCIRQAAGAHVVNRQHRVMCAEPPTTIDDFLRAALHLRIAALDRIEIELFGVHSGIHARGSPAAEPDAHSRSTELHEQGARRQIVLAHLIVADVADTPRDHDRLVITVTPGADLLFVAAKVPEQIRAAELVVERRGADRALDHYRQRVRNARREAEVVLPCVPHAGQAQVRYRKSAQASLRLRPTPGGTFIADLATGAGGCTGIGRDRRGMVVRLDLEYRVRQLIACTVVDADCAGGMVTMRIEARHAAAFEHGGVVAVRDHGPQRCGAMRGADHVEQRRAFVLAVDRPCSVEYLVAAMLGVGLREHHQLDISRVALHAGERCQQIVDLVAG